MWLVKRTGRTMLLLGACVSTALVVALVLSAARNNRAPAPTGFGQLENQVSCGSQVGLSAAERLYQPCLYSQPLSSLTGRSPAGEQAPRGGRWHWSLVVRPQSTA